MRTRCRCAADPHVGTREACPLKPVPDGLYLASIRTDPRACARGFRRGMSGVRSATGGRHLKQRGEGERRPLEEPSKICTADLAGRPSANLIFAATKRSPDPEPAAGLGIKRATRQTKAKTARASGTPIHGLALGVSGAGNVHAGRDCCEKQAGTGERSTPHRIRTCNLRGVPLEASPSRLASLNRPDGR